MTTEIDIPKGKVLRVAAKKAGFRRGGLSHPDTAVLHDPETLEPAQIAAILAEPMLIADWVDAPAPTEDGDDATKKKAAAPRAAQSKG